MSNTETNNKRAYRRRARAWRIIRPLVSVWVRLRYGFHVEEREQLEEIGGPLIIAINHANALDPLFTSVAFRRPISFIASEHLLRVRPWGALLDRYFCLIPHRKGAGRTGTSRACLEHLAGGAAIYLAAEGEQSWDGVSGTVKPHTGRLIKRSGATLITYRIEGAYLAGPRWSGRRRRGKVSARPVQIYTPETLARMSEEEIEGTINRDLEFNIWNRQKEQPGGPVRYRAGRDAAVGLEKAVCVCPSCHRLGELSTQGDTIRCSCGFSLRWSETGFFEPREPFETIVEWEAFDREQMGRFLRESKCEWPADEDVTLRLVHEGHQDEPVERGALAIQAGSRPGMSIGDRCFAFDAIEQMAMILDKRIVFTVDGDYYELIGEHANMRKYLTAWEILREEG